MVVAATYDPSLIRLNLLHAYLACLQWPKLRSVVLSCRAGYCITVLHHTGWSSQPNGLHQWPPLAGPAQLLLLGQTMQWLCNYLYIKRIRSSKQAKTTDGHVMLTVARRPRHSLRRNRSSPQDSSISRTINQPTHLMHLECSRTTA